MSFSWVSAHLAEIADWTLQHIWLSLVPVLLGFVIAVPLGYIAYRFRFTRATIITLAALLYTVPSIALFIVIPGILGTQILSPVNVIVALTMYSVAMLVRVVVDGLLSVPAPVKDAARGIGLGGGQVFWRVELPVALPVMFAGLRVAAMSSVSLVSVSALIGTRQLGLLFTQGFKAGDEARILVGIVLIGLLAFVFDQAVVWSGRALTPWRRAVG